MRGERVATNSMMATFLNCRRKFWYSYRLRLTPKTPMLHFFVGSVWHGALARFYEGADRDGVLKWVDETFLKARAAWLSDTQMLRLEQAHAMLQGALRAYHEKYMERDLDEFDVVAVERPFKRKFPERLQAAPGWMWAGVMDLVVRMRKGPMKGRIGLYEHKTTQYLDEDYVGKVPQDPQIHQYAWGINAVFKEPPAKVVYNVLQKAALRQKKGESFEEFVQRLKDAYLNDPGRYFWRGVVSIPKWSLERHKRDVAWATREISRADGIGFDAFYMNKGHCFAYGICEFFEVCAVESPEGVIKTRFKVREAVHPELERTTEVSL